MFTHTRVKIILSLVCIVIFLMAAEGYVRFKGYIPATKELQTAEFLEEQFYPVLGWVAISNSHVPIGEPDPLQLKTKLWPDGQRESRSLVKRRGKTRVLVLGCSHTFGTGVLSKETFTWLLNERFPDMTFDNFSFPGYGTLQCVINAEIQLSRRSYDLVIYAPIDDHIFRNAFAATCLRDTIAEHVTLPELLKIEHPLWMMPTARIVPKHQLYFHFPYYNHWPFDRYSALSNTLKRLGLYYDHCKNMQLIDNASAVLSWREVYWRLLLHLHSLTTKYGSKLAVICLEDNAESSNLLMYPNPNELAQMHSPGQPLSFPPPYFYAYAGSGRNGAPDGPQFHVGGLDYGHPAPLVHRFWAEKIAEMIPSIMDSTAQ